MAKLQKTKEPVRIALAQINSVMGDLAGNRERLDRMTAQARERGAQLIVFPELALCGYPPEDLLLRPKFLRDMQRTLVDFARGVKDAVVVAGFAHETSGHVYNAAAVIARGRVQTVYHKRELPNYGVFDEKRYFRPGAGPVEFSVNGLRLGLTICEDIWVRGGDVECSLVGRGLDAILNLSASPFHAGKFAERKAIVTSFARRTRAAIVYCNLVGGQDELVFDGGSLAVDARGNVFAAAGRFTEDLLVLDLAGERPKPVRSAGSLPRPALKVAAAAAQPPLPRRPRSELSRLEEIHAALILGTRDYVRKNGFAKVVIGLSGGIDSSLTAALAVEALGAGQVTGVTMPSGFTSAETLGDAERTAANLGFPCVRVPIGDILAQYRRSLADWLQSSDGGVEYENLQARIRGNILMAFSNRFGWLVLTTGNKSEIATGYCTLYGDMAGGFAVIKDVPKTLVYELAARINAQAGRDLIPASVMIRPPTAELRPNQKDSDSLPPYAVLDPVLQAYVEEERSPEQIVAQGFAPDVVREVIRLVDGSEYKRRQSPPGVKITPRAFGRDRRLPITNQYRLGLTPKKK